MEERHILVKRNLQHLVQSLANQHHKVVDLVAPFRRGADAPVVFLQMEAEQILDDGADAVGKEGHHVKGALDVGDKGLIQSLAESDDDLFQFFILLDDYVRLALGQSHLPHANCDTSRGQSPFVNKCNRVCSSTSYWVKSKGGIRPFLYSPFL